MKASIPDDFVTLSTAVSIAAEDWFPGDFLRTFVDPIEWRQANKVEFDTQITYQSIAPGSTNYRSRLHSAEISTPNTARVQTLQEKLNGRQQLLRTVWPRFRQLLFWGELPSKILTDGGRIEDIPASLWLGEFGNRAYVEQSNGDPVAKINLSLSNESLEGYIILESAEVWRVVSAPQLCRAAFRPANNCQGGIFPSEIGRTESRIQNSPQDSAAIQDLPRSIVLRAGQAPSVTEKKRLGRGPTQRIRAEKALTERFPNGIPRAADMGNKTLVLEARKYIPKNECISDQTILRAAGRKR
jgi:hypothetical protein